MSSDRKPWKVERTDSGGDWQLARWHDDQKEAIVLADVVALLMNEREAATGPTYEYRISTRDRGFSGPMDSLDEAMRRRGQTDMIQKRVAGGPWETIPPFPVTEPEPDEIVDLGPRPGEAPSTEDEIAEYRQTRTWPPVPSVEDIAVHVYEHVPEVEWREDGLGGLSETDQRAWIDAFRSPLQPVLDRLTAVDRTIAELLGDAADEIERLRADLATCEQNENARHEGERR